MEDRGFQGNCNCCGTLGHHLNECWLKDQDMKAKGGGEEEDLGAEKGGPVEGWQYRMGIKERTWTLRSKRRCLGRRKGRVQLLNVV